MDFFANMFACSRPGCGDGAQSSQRHRILANEVLDIGLVRRNVVEVLNVSQPMRTPSLAIARQGELFGVSTIRRDVVVAENREPSALVGGLARRNTFPEKRAKTEKLEHGRERAGL
jgi:hypothetical protein